MLKIPLFSKEEVCRTKLLRMKSNNVQQDDLKCICFISHISKLISNVWALKQTEMLCFNLWMVPLCLIGLVQPVHGIWLGLWPRWHLKLQLLFDKLYSAFKVE